jgi:hypothetical protein
MKVSWYAPAPDGRPGFGSNQLVVPGRYNFLQAAIYRLKLSAIPNRPGLELYPTLEVVPSNARTDTFLAHSAVPVTFTDEDLDQVVAGNYVVKVVYLPFPQFQDLATTGPDEVVSSRLEPGADPIAEACRRGNILVVVRLGNIDLEAPNTPAMDAPSPYAPKAALPPASGFGHGGAGPGPMVPYGFMNQGKPLMMGPGNLMNPGDLGGGMGAPLPPGGAVPPASPATPGGPLGKANQPPGIQQAQAQQYAPSTAELASQDSSSPPQEKKSWWHRHRANDTKSDDNSR